MPTPRLGDGLLVVSRGGLYFWNESHEANWEVWFENDVGGRKALPCGFEGRSVHSHGVAGSVDNVILKHDLSPIGGNETVKTDALLSGGLLVGSCEVTNPSWFPHISTWGRGSTERRVVRIHVRETVALDGTSWQTIGGGGGSERQRCGGQSDSEHLTWYTPIK